MHALRDGVVSLPYWLVREGPICRTGEEQDSVSVPETWSLLAAGSGEGGRHGSAVFGFGFGRLSSLF